MKPQVFVRRAEASEDERHGFRVDPSANVPDAIHRKLEWCNTTYVYETLLLVLDESSRAPRSGPD